MQNRGQLLLGIFLLLFGVLLLLGNLFEINVWAVCWPTAVILIGIWMIIRPRVTPAVNLQIFADVKRRGAWQVSDEEIWLFVGDVDLDLTRAQTPLGETRIRITGFVGDVDVLLPAEVGFCLSSTAFFNESRVLGRKDQRFLVPLEFTSANFSDAEQRLRLETTFFVGDLNVRRIPATEG